MNGAKPDPVWDFTFGKSPGVPSENSCGIPICAGFWNPECVKYRKNPFSSSYWSYHSMRSGSTGQATNGSLLVPFLNLIWCAFCVDVTPPTWFKRKSLVMACPETWDTCPSVLGSMLVWHGWIGLCVTFQFLQCPDFNASKCILNLCVLVFIYVDLVEGSTSLTLNIGALSDRVYFAFCYVGLAATFARLIYPQISKCHKYKTSICLCINMQKYMHKYAGRETSLIFLILSFDFVVDLFCEIQSHRIWDY